MFFMKIGEIARLTSGVMVCGDPDAPAVGISIDSRTIRPLNLFVALKGQNFNGVEFVGDAFDRGATGAIISTVPSNINPATETKALILVKNSIKALLTLAHYYRIKFKIPVIGITGSNGKTNTREMLSGILDLRGPIIKSFSLHENRIDVPMTILGISEKHKFAVIEVGVETPSYMELLVKSVLPDYVIITNLGEAHMGLLGNKEKILEAKSELLKVLPKSGTAILNKDDEFVSSLNPVCPCEHIIKFGFHKNADYFAEQVQFHGEDGISYLLNGKFKTSIKSLSSGDIYNSLAAIATASALGFELEEILEALEKKFRLPCGHGELLKENGIKIIDFSYNSDPHSLRDACLTLMKFRTSSTRLIMIIGDMLELGQNTEKIHHNFGHYLRAYPINILITIGPYAKYIGEAASDKTKTSIQHFHFSSILCLEQALSNLCKAGDTILVTGSRGIQMGRIIEHLIENLRPV